LSLTYSAKATTRGFHQSVLSNALVFLSIGWIVFYINTGAKNSAAVLSAPLILFSGISVVTLLLLLVPFRTHNQTTYQRRYSQWERSFLCERCGTLI
jgi:hypothetical protein